ncbi:MAG: hypothetical protein H6709_05170 [Kofleriaceae bacterium]|nr:hypothetical protein [Kofleriaceae bacterium]MCB9571463.1 hypothetical protein [Kofleriaceae bacterium]
MPTPLAPRRPVAVLAAALVAAVAAAGCADPAPEPDVVVLAATPDSLHTGDDTRDDLAIRVAYHDGDADLGGGVAAIHDCRADGVVTSLELPAIASAEAVAAGVPISGELELWVADVGDVARDAVAPPACAALGVAAPVDGEVIFCVVLRDAAGHDGAGDCTPPIAIAP